MSTTDFSRQQCRIRRDNTNSINPSWKARKNPPKVHTKNRPFYSAKFQRIGYATCYIQKWDPKKKIFDSYGSSLIFDNSVNDNICSEEDMFTEKIEPIISNELANIGGKYLIPKWIVTVSWSWTYDEGKLHTKKFNNVLYFPYSSFNILSETAMAKFIKYYDGKWVPTKGKYYIYTWGISEYKKTISHPEIIFHN